MASPGNAQVLRDGTLGPGVGAQPTGPDYVVDPSMGVDMDTNLFHSFAELSFGQAVSGVEESLYFVGPGFDNILARVTGGNVSTIDGLLRADSNLYLLNPAGILFGANSRLEVDGWLRATTADYVLLGDDGLFSASNPASSVLSAAPPSAFGFLPRAVEREIVVHTSPEEVDTFSDGPVSLIADRVTVGDLGDPSRIRVPGNLVELVAVSGVGELPLDGGPTTFSDLDGFAELGRVAVNNAAIEVSADGAGSIVLLGGVVTVDGQSSLTAHSRDGAGGKIEIRARDQVAVRETSRVESLVSGAGSSPDILIVAPAIVIGGRSEVVSRALNDASGVVGSLRLEAEESIAILSQNISPEKPRFTSVRTEIRGSATGGDLQILVPEGELEIGCESPGGNACGAAARVEAEVHGSQSGGRLLVDAGRIVVRDGGLIRSFVKEGASPDVTGPKLDVIGHKFISVSGTTPQFEFENRSGIGSFAEGAARGGDVLIRTPSLTLSESARVFSESRPKFGGRGGDIRIEVGTLSVASDAEIASLTRTVSASGNIVIVASESVDLRGTDRTGDVFESVTTGVSARNQVEAGRAGDVSIDTPLLTVREGAVVTTLSLVEGAGGTVRIRGGRIVVSDGGIIDSSTALLGPGGDIDIQASESVVVAGADSQGRPSRIGSVALSLGDAGNVRIEAPLVVVDGGVIASTALGVGELELAIELDMDPGDELPPDAVIELTLREGLQLLGGFPSDGEIQVTLFGTTSTFTVAEFLEHPLGKNILPDPLFENPNFNDANAGSIDLDVGRLVVTGGGQVDTSSFSAGSAGALDIQASESVSVSGPGSAIVSRPGPGGSGGGISIEAPIIRVEDGGRISIGSAGARLDVSLFLAAFEDVLNRFFMAGLDLGGLGVSVVLPDGLDAALLSDLLAKSREGRGPVDAGRLALRADVLALQGGSVDARAESASGGVVDIDVGFLTMEDALIDASVVDGTGGNIVLRVDDTLGMSRSAIRAEATPGSGGNIDIEVGEGVFLDSSEITASVTGGGGGNVTLSSGLVVLDDSRIIAQAVTGDGGNISIVADVLIASPDSLIDASSQFGLSGTVEIRAPDADIAGDLAVLPASFLDASALMREHCAARGSRAATGSFAVMGAGGVPPGPGGPLPARPPGLATFVSDAVGSVTHHGGLILARSSSGRSVAWTADCGG